MIKLYFAPRTRSVRVLWLLEELGLDYELEHVTFEPPAKQFFGQKTPTGKLPTIEDGNIVMSESGAIIEYILERYGEGRLAPAQGTPERAAYLQWFHFAESTAFPPLGILVWLTVYREGRDNNPDLLADAMARARIGLDQLEQHLETSNYLAGDAFTAADIMMGFTVLAAAQLGAMDDTYKSINAWVARLLERPALQKAMSFT